MTKVAIKHGGRPKKLWSQSFASAERVEAEIAERLRSDLKKLEADPVGTGIEITVHREPGRLAVECSLVRRGG